MELLLTILAAYLIGSIPFGLLLTKLAGLGDIRAIGSGNIGATNVLRTGNKWLALATLALDFAKAFAALTLLEHPFFVASAVVIGHMFPLWLKFKGGKAVACLFGLSFALSPIAGACAAIGWLAIFFITRYSSLSALVGLPAGLLASLAWIPQDRLLALALPVLLMLLKHHENIRRLLKGEEHRFTFKEKEGRK